MALNNEHEKIGYLCDNIYVQGCVSMRWLLTLFKEDVKRSSCKCKAFGAA